MLDRNFIVDNVEAVKKNCRDRGMTADVDRLVALDAECRNRLKEVEDLNRRANEVSKSIGKCKDDAEREQRKDEGRRLRDAKDQAQQTHDELAAQILEIQRTIPNMAHPDAPIGVDDHANLEVQRGQHEPRKFDFKPLDHVDLGQRLDLFDFEAGSKVTGHGFYFLKNDAVLLELALQQFAVNRLMKEGFTLTTTPDMARLEILEGIGFNPRGQETQIYSIAEHRLESGGNRRNHPRRLLLGSDPGRRTTADQDVRHQPLFPHRGRRRRACHAWTVSRASIY